MAAARVGHTQTDIEYRDRDRLTRRGVVDYGIFPLPSAHMSIQQALTVVVTPPSS
jgi:hypothetical protein